MPLLQHDIRMTAQKIAKRLALIAPLQVRRWQSLAPLKFKALDGPAAPLPLHDDPNDGGWTPILPGTFWGASNLNFALRGEFTVPPDFDQSVPVELALPIGDAGEFCHPEALVYIDGEPYATADRHHQSFRLPAAFCDGAPHQLLLYGWTGMWGVLGRHATQHPAMHECGVAQIDPVTREFVVAARNALETANLLDDPAPAKARLYNTLDEAFKLLDTREPLGDDFYATVPAALACLRDGIAGAGAPLDADLVAAGHAHIDVAWLWTLGQTRLKAGRTFHTTIRLMEQFPEYRFTQSQPQLYDFVRQDYPALFQAIKERVAEGRWEPIGGMWVEADCNITGPESLARQFLLGRTFFRQHFGPDADSPVLWLPDVFGYSWSLPQLIKLAGMDYFFTIKISWNQVNKLPYDSFWWEGLDGTRVLTHLSTVPPVPHTGETIMRYVATYNAELAPYGTLGAWAKLQHKESQRVMLMSYGYGDGGGGPTREMNENAQALKAMPGMPRVTQGRVIDFYRRLEAESGDRLPTWNNELYLELHRGTYTTQSRNKRGNRKSEFLLHDAEFLASLASLLDAGYAYPTDQLHRAWELVCLNQFHDIIPGSSVHDVYTESQQQYAEIETLGRSACDAALGVVKSHAGGDVLLVNPASFTREDLAFWPGELPAGRRFVSEVYSQPTNGGVWVGRRGGIAPFSVTPLSLEEGEPAAPTLPLHAEPGLLENAFVRVELDSAGDITRIYDKTASREVLAPGGVAGQFQAFEDRPLEWDAWDVDLFYDDKLYLAEPAESVRVVEDGPLRATLEIRRRILNSAYTQRISLAYNSPEITFDTVIDWRERHIFLKAAFPVDILSPVATYEIQWGSVQRPTHSNTSWDWARFETAAQKWVDLSEGGYGVALLNDCKYGHDIHDNVIRLSLLRGPTEPDPEADQGEQHFAYRLYPHANAGGGPALNSDIARRAYCFNDPLIAAGGSPVRADQPQHAQALASLVELPPRTIVETIKRAEDGNGLIVRFYECNRQRGPVTLRAGFPLREAWITNLLEENWETLPVDGQSAALFVKPFQIVTVRLVPAG